MIESPVPVHVVAAWCPVCRVFSPPTRSRAWHEATAIHKANVREPERRVRITAAALVEVIERVVAQELVRVVELESTGRVLALSVENRAARWAIGLTRAVLAAIDASRTCVFCSGPDRAGPCFGGDKCMNPLAALPDEVYVGEFSAEYIDGAAPPVREDEPTGIDPERLQAALVGDREVVARALWRTSHTDLTPREHAERIAAEYDRLTREASHVR